jgi:hypothetical protein
MNGAQTPSKVGPKALKLSKDTLRMLSDEALVQVVGASFALCQRPTHLTGA